MEKDKENTGTPIPEDLYREDEPVNFGRGCMLSVVILILIWYIIINIIW
jgi:hypothetical protein